MATLIINNAYLVAINMTSGGQDVTNVIGVRGDFSSAQTVATQVLAAWTAVDGPLNGLNFRVVMKNVTATDLSTVNGDIAVVQSAQAGGISTGTLATNGACALVTYGGGTRSRSSKGRMYFGPISDAAVQEDGRSLTAATTEVYRNRMVAMWEDLESVGLAWCVISRKLQEARPFPSSSIGVQNIIATQRRRIRG